MVAKVAEVRAMLDRIRSKARLETDGGLTADTLTLVLRAGSDAFVSAHSIFHHPDGIGAGILSLRKAMPV